MARTTAAKRGRKSKGQKSKTKTAARPDVTPGAADDDDEGAILAPAVEYPKVGRPTKYDRVLCERVVALGAEGKGKAQIAVRLGISRQTLDNWAVEHPEFLDSIKVAHDLCQAWWEDTGQINLTRKGFNQSSYIFQMKNRFRSDYQDLQIKEISGPNGGPIETLEQPRSPGDDHLAELSQRYNKPLQVINGGKK